MVLNAERLTFERGLHPIGGAATALSAPPQNLPTFV
jgi:hypothetical protein